MTSARATGLVEVDRAVHVEAGEQVSLGGGEAFAGQVESPAGRVGAKLPVIQARSKWP